MRRHRPHGRACHCEGCSPVLGWVVVRLPEPLYRVARWLL